jgi:hypothetical protein
MFYAGCIPSLPFSKPFFPIRDTILRIPECGQDGDEADFAEKLASAIRCRFGDHWKDES